MSCRQLSPLWSHLLMVITPSVCNYPDSDLLMFKMLFYHATHQGKFFEVHMFLSATVWYTLTQPLHIHSHLATATSAAQLAAGTARQLRCTSVVTAEREGDLDVSPHVILPVHYLQSVRQRHNRISRHLFTSPSTSGDE